MLTIGTIILVGLFAFVGEDVEAIVALVVVAVAMIGLFVRGMAREAVLRQRDGS